MTALDRSYRIDGDELSYSLQMRAVGQPAGSPCRRVASAALSSTSVELCHTVADNSAGYPNPALGTPGGVDQRSFALGDGEVTAEVIGNPDGRGTGRFVFGDAQVGGKHAGAQRASGAVGQVQR